jgi:iron complex outermembrane recepter protein
MGDLTQIDLARVEVLRGPQGTLYGRNANGGVVNFITQAPTSEREGYLLGSYASFDESRLQGLINLPLSDRFQARLVVDHWNRGEGFVKNVVPGNPDLERGRATSGRLRLAAQITDTFKADLSLTGHTASGPTGYYTLTSAPSATDAAEGALVSV